MYTCMTVCIIISTVNVKNVVLKLCKYVSKFDLILKKINVFSSNLFIHPVLENIEVFNAVKHIFSMHVLMD